MTEITLKIGDDVYSKIKDNVWLYGHLVQELEEFLHSDISECVALRISDPISEQIIEITIDSLNIYQIVEKYREWLIKTEQYEKLNHADELIKLAKKKQI